MIAESDEECFDMLSENQAFDTEYEDRIMPNIAKAPRFVLADENEESRIIDIFLT